VTLTGLNIDDACVHENLEIEAAPERVKRRQQPPDRLQGGDSMAHFVPDVKTVMMMDVLIATVNATVAAIVWRSYRNLTGVPELAAGFICMALVTIPTPQGTSPVDCIVKLLSDLDCSLALGLTARGLARFLGQRRSRFLPHLLCLYTFLTIGAALLVAPEDRALRAIVTFPTIAAAIYGYIVTLWHDRKLSGWLRFPPIGISLIWLLLAAGLAGNAAIHGVPPRSENGDLEALYWMMAGLIPDAMFLCVLALMAARLRRRPKIGESH
jgi:hypothetical protein